MTDPNHELEDDLFVERIAHHMTLDDVAALERRLAAAHDRNTELRAELEHLRSTLGAENARLLAIVANLAEQMVWMSACDCFAPGGVAHDGWVGMAQPALNDALVVLAGVGNLVDPAS